MPEVSATIDVKPVVLVFLWTCEVACLYKVETAKDCIHHDIHYVLEVERRWSALVS